MENEGGESEMASIRIGQNSTTLWSSWKSMIENTKKISYNLERKLRSKEGDGANEIMLRLSIPHLSPLAHTVISRCSRILQISTEELQQRFDLELPDKVRQPSNYARNFLEFCSFQTIHLSSMHSDYLSKKDFRRLMYDMMLAWESSGAENALLVNDTVSSSISEGEGEGEGEDESLFYSTTTKMAVQVDDEKTVGREAFARIAPACLLVADIITVYNLFDVLTSSSDHRLHFLIFDKYLKSLQKVVKDVHSEAGTQFGPNSSLSEEEIILYVDGTVLQHIGIPGWPGRLTLTDHALYFESGVHFYNKAERYDLAMDQKQSIKPTGPLGSRLFDKALMYKSMSIEQPVCFGFPELKGSSRRDYWLDICLEILLTHRFIRKYNLKGNQRREALCRASLGILRYRAITESFHLFTSSYKTLLCFNLAENLPGGDAVLDTLSSQCTPEIHSLTGHDDLGSSNANKSTMSPSLLTLHWLGILSFKEAAVNGKVSCQAGCVCVGEINPLETAVKRSIQGSGRAEAALESVSKVKVEGIDTNFAVTKELLGPLISSFEQLQLLMSWDEPWKSLLFLVLVSFTVIRDWIQYVLPLMLLLLAISMLWHKYTSQRRPLAAFKIMAPPTKNPVEQLLTLQEAIREVEISIQSINIFLLKARALIFAVVPQETAKVCAVLVCVAVAITLIPVKYMILLVFVESFTRNMALRRASSERCKRRIKEWWIGIPAAPLQLIKSNDKKRE